MVSLTDLLTVAAFLAGGWAIFIFGYGLGTLMQRVLATSKFRTAFFVVKALLAILSIPWLCALVSGAINLIWSACLILVFGAVVSYWRRVAWLKERISLQSMALTDLDRWTGEVIASNSDEELLRVKQAADSLALSIGVDAQLMQLESDDIPTHIAEQLAKANVSYEQANSLHNTALAARSRWQSAKSTAQEATNRVRTLESKGKSADLHELLAALREAVSAYHDVDEHLMEDVRSCFLSQCEFDRAVKHFKQARASLSGDPDVARLVMDATNYAINLITKSEAKEVRLRFTSANSNRCIWATVSGEGWWRPKHLLIPARIRIRTIDGDIAAGEPPSVDESSRNRGTGDNQLCDQLVTVVSLVMRGELDVDVLFMPDATDGHKHESLIANSQGGWDSRRPRTELVSI